MLSIRHQRVLLVFNGLKRYEKIRVKNQCIYIADLIEQSSKGVFLIEKEDFINNGPSFFVSWLYQRE